jgi:hypothetical protein
MPVYDTFVNFNEFFSGERQLTRRGDDRILELFLPLGGELRRLSGGQTAGAARFAGRGAALPSELGFEFREGGHDGRHCTTGRGGCVNSFSQGAQYDSALSQLGDGAGDFGDGSAETIDRCHEQRVAGQEEQL